MVFYFSAEFMLLNVVSGLFFMFFVVLYVACD